MQYNLYNITNYKYLVMVIHNRFASNYNKRPECMSYIQVDFNFIGVPRTTKIILNSFLEQKFYCLIITTCTVNTLYIISHHFINYPGLTLELPGGCFSPSMLPF